MATPLALRLRGRIIPPVQTMASHAPGRPTPSSRPLYPSTPFSTTAAQFKRRTSDNNPNRGVSSIHRSGPRQMLSMSDEPLPQPSGYRPKIKVDPDHGLWGFFPKPFSLMRTPEEDSQHGRAWTVPELRKKSWEDLHKLWWVCLRERNVLATARTERTRARVGFGDSEGAARDLEVRKTMKAIKHTLTERFYTWEDSRELAKTDPEINLSGYGPAYKPSDYYEADEGAVSDNATRDSEGVRAEEPAVEVVGGERLATEEVKGVRPSGGEVKGEKPTVEGCKHEEPIAEDIKVEEAWTVKSDSGTAVAAESQNGEVATDTRAKDKSDGKETLPR